MLCLAPPAVAEESVAAGAAVFEREGCGECHRVQPPGSGFGFADRVAQKGPDLWYAGSKFQPGWLKAWLTKPDPVMGIRFDSLEPDTSLSPHPRIPPDQVPDLAAYLESLVDAELPVGMVAASEPTSRMELLRGRILFGKEQQCFACHRTRTRYGVEVGGVTAPSLGDAGKRLNPDWVYGFLMDPKRYTPVTRMPIYRGDTYTDYQAQEMKLLARYIATMGVKR